MTHKELKGKNYEEIQNLIEKEFVTFNDELSADDLETLKKKEQTIIKELEEYDSYLDQVTYTLPKEKSVKGETISIDVIAKLIVDFVDTMEVDFQYTLGLYELSKFWQGNPKEVRYKVFDSTLRCLGGLKFKGFDSWKNILTVHEYLSSCQEDYKRDLAYYIYLSSKHNAIMDKMKELQAPETPAE